MQPIMGLPPTITRCDILTRSIPCLALIPHHSKTKADYVKYYKNSLLYLACVDPAKDLTPLERLTRAHDLGISAMLGETIYNFGELVSPPPCG